MDVGDMVDARYLVMLFWDSWGSDIRTVVSDRCVKYGKVVVSSSLSRGRILRYACRKHYLNIEANARPTRTMIGSRSVIGEISMGFATFWEDDLECSFGTCSGSFSFGLFVRGLRAGGFDVAGWAGCVRDLVVLVVAALVDGIVKSVSRAKRVGRVLRSGETG